MSDVNVKAVVRFGIGLAIAAAAIHAALALLLAAFAARQPAAAAIRQPAFSVTHPREEQVYRPQRELLERYEWIDRRAGVVRIPIDRAIDLLSEESK